jgi:hypothetical protein
MQFSQVRLYAILARDAPFGVIFRRGPSRQVLLIGWNTAGYTFQIGQWLKGRIYERRSDLSPKGDMLVYFAVKYLGPIRSWTAISRPPFLTALAMWPKGDGWGGGGQFISQTQLALNHRESEFGLAEGIAVPRWLKVKPFGEYSGRSEDGPIYDAWLRQEGWRPVEQPIKTTKHNLRAKVWFEFSPPIRWRKAHPKYPKRYSLEMSLRGIKEKDGPWYLFDHSVLRDGIHQDRIGRSDWADWSRSGDLLFAMDGCLYRTPCAKGVLGPLESSIKLADFTDLRFAPSEAPAEFRRWPEVNTYDDFGRNFTRSLPTGAPLIRGFRMSGKKDVHVELFLPHNKNRVVWGARGSIRFELPPRSRDTSRPGALA